jgi:hypothetical protein
MEQKDTLTFCVLYDDYARWKLVLAVLNLRVMPPEDVSYNHFFVPVAQGQIS